MSFDERLEAIWAKREELRAKHDDRVKAVRESIDEGDKKFAEDMQTLKWAFGEASAELNEQADAIDAKIDARIDEKIDASEARRENIRAKVEGFKAEIEKAEQEALIVDILVYAEDCADIAAYYSQEADFAMAAAEELIAIYNEKFGE